MENKLEVLVGREVLKAALKDCNGALFFDAGIKLFIFNRITLSGFDFSDTALVGKLVIAVKEQNDKILINLNEGFDISIDMRPEAYNGPEALELVVPNRPIVIWN